MIQFRTLSKRMLSLLLLALILFCVYQSQALAVQNSKQRPSQQNQAIATEAVVTYQLLFSQFTPVQISQLQSFMRHYSGYKSQALILQNSSSTKLTYISTAHIDLLMNNLQKTTQHLGIEVLIRSAGENINIRFIQLSAKSLPYKQW